MDDHYHASDDSPSSFFPKQDRVLAAANWVQSQATEWLATQQKQQQQHPSVKKASNLPPILENLNQAIQRTTQNTATAIGLPKISLGGNNVDMDYITDRLLVASAPTKPINPTYNDIGRDMSDANRGIQVTSIDTNTNANTNINANTNSDVTDASVASVPIDANTSQQEQLHDDDSSVVVIMENPQEGGEAATSISRSSGHLPAHDGQPTTTETVNKASDNQHAISLAMQTALPQSPTITATVNSHSPPNLMPTSPADQVQPILTTANSNPVDTSPLPSENAVSPAQLEVLLQAVRTPMPASPDHVRQVLNDATSLDLPESVASVDTGESSPQTDGDSLSPFKMAYSQQQILEQGLQTPMPASPDHVRQVLNDTISQDLPRSEHSVTSKTSGGPSAIETSPTNSQAKLAQPSGEPAPVSPDQASSTNDQPLSHIASDEFVPISPKQMIDPMKSMMIPTQDFSEPQQVIDAVETPMPASPDHVRRVMNEAISTEIPPSRCTSAVVSVPSKRGDIDDHISSQIIASQAAPFPPIPTQPPASLSILFGSSHGTSRITLPVTPTSSIATSDKKLQGHLEGESVEGCDTSVLPRSPQQHEDENRLDDSPLKSAPNPGSIPSTGSHRGTSTATDTKTLPTKINSPASMASVLERRHGIGHFLAIALTDDPPDDRFLTIWRRQVVHVGWKSPCLERSETPCLPHLIEICWIMHAYLMAHVENVVMVYCANGKTRSSIALGCYLKFSGHVQSSREGFTHVLRQRGVENPEQKVLPQLPASLLLFLDQFDETIDMKCILNRKPLLLRAIAVQGVPVDDKPCLDIWDSSAFTQGIGQEGNHVYSSHPEMWERSRVEDRKSRNGMHQDANGKSNEKENIPTTSQWGDEEGYYKVDTVVEGDFVLLCRFGGDFAQEATLHDPSKILFRYASTTAYLAGGGPHELDSDQVDLMRRYKSSLDHDDFRITFLWEAYWEKRQDTMTDEMYQRLTTDSERLLPRETDVVWGKDDPETSDYGWKLLVKYHSAQPMEADCGQLVQQNPDLEECPTNLILLALQLANFNLTKAAAILQDDHWEMSYWREWLVSDAIHRSEEAAGEEKDVHLDNDEGQHVDPDYDDGETTVAIFDLLDRVNADLGIGVSSSQSPFIDNLPDQERQSSAWEDGALAYLPPIQYPHPGDIMAAFGPYYQQMCSGQLGHNNRSDSEEQNQPRRPRLPYFSQTHPSMFPHTIGPEADDSNGAYPLDESYYNHIPVYDEDKEAAMQTFMRLRHSGVRLSDLTDLLSESRKWTGFPYVEPELELEPSEQDEETESVEAESPMGLKNTASMNREAKESQQKKWEDAKKAEAKLKGDKKKLDAEEKEKQHPDGAQQKPSTNEGPTSTSKDSGEEKSDQDDLPLKDDPEYSKYFKMLKMGMPKEQVTHAFQRDDKDPTILDMDPNQSLKSQLPKDDLPIKDDPDYEKYFKMLKMGLPKGAVQNALTRDGKDPSVMDLDPNKSLKSQKPANTTTGEDDADVDDGPVLKDDPDYAKYFKMLSMGLPMGAVQNALTRDGKDPKIMELDPNKSVKSQMKSDAEEDTGPPLKEDPEYSKYFKMLTMGLPIGAVKNALTRDGKDPSIMDLDPTKSLKSQTGSGDEEADTGPPLKDDPEYAKYFKMLTMGLPVGAVKNALGRDGLDPSIMDLDPNKSLKSQMGGDNENDTGVPLKDDPDYAKYFKMQTMGLPKGAVQNALERDGKDPAVMELDPEKSVAFQLAKKSKGGAKKPAKKKKRVRRKKVYWTPIDESKIEEDSMWNIVKGAVRMNQLSYDEKEFEDLFTESADPGQTKKKTASASTAKKSVQVIDGKRSMNGGIILARLKVDYTKIAQIVDKMETGKFDSTQLKALKEFLADADERRGLLAVMKKGEGSEEARAQIMSELSETEKYMITMMVVKDAPRKFDAILFRTVFKSRFEEMKADIKTLNKACDEVRSSERLRKLMAMILAVVNQINTGGEGKMAIGFTLEALLKLNEAKAFDKKTSVLHYLAKVVKKNDPELLKFEGDLNTVIPAENVVMDGLSSDVNALLEDLGPVHETVKEEAERLEKAGDLRPMSLSELKEQVTVVQKVEGVQQFNKVDHRSGRTSMERFTINAKIAAEQAAESIDNVKQKYVKLLGYFGEDDKMPSTDFFGILRRFMKGWLQAIEQVEAIELAAAKEKKKADKKAAKEAAKASKAKGAATKSAAKPGGRNGSSNDKGGKPALDPKTALADAIKAKGKAGDDKKGASAPQGIGALAAAAALKKQGSAEAEPRKRSSLEDALISHNTRPGQGVAAFASGAATLKPNSARKQSPEKGSIPATTDRKDEQSEASVTFASKAAAYRKKRGKKDDKDVEGGTGSTHSRATTSTVKLNDDSAGNGDTTAAPAATTVSTPIKKVTAIQEDAGPSTHPEKPTIAAGTGAANDETNRALSQPLLVSSASAAAAAYSTKMEDHSDLRVDSNTTAEVNNIQAESDAAYHNEPTPKAGNEDKSSIVFGETQHDMVSPLGSPAQIMPQAILSEGGEDSTRGVTDADKVNPTAILAEILATHMQQNASKSPVKSPENNRGPSLSSFFSQNSRRSPDSMEGQSPEKNVSYQASGLPSKSLANFIQNGDDDASLTSYDPRFKNYDDSSVANFTMSTETDERRGKSPRLSMAWKQGDTIENWSNWANQLVNESDTQSVANFEAERDLADPNDFDDDSTIATATYMDDMTVDGNQSYYYDEQSESGDHFQAESLADGHDPYYFNTQSVEVEYAGSPSSATPTNISKIAKSILHDDSSSQESGAPPVTPAKVAASILYTDSPASSTDFTPAKSNITGREGSEDMEQYDTIDATAAMYYDDAGFDAGLSFGAPANPGLDDGLMAFGATTDVDAFGNGLDVPNLDERHSSNAETEGEKGGDKKTRWLPWT